MSAPVLQRLHPDDDVIVALAPVRRGESAQLDGCSWTLRDDVAAKHKFAAKNVRRGERVRMYGVTVGMAAADIPAGGLITTTNLVHATDGFSTKRRDHTWTPPDVRKFAGATFQGFRRATGPAGTANYWIVAPLVFCENRNLKVMREALQTALGYSTGSPHVSFARELAAAWSRGDRAAFDSAEIAAGRICQQRLFPHVDGVKFLEHGLGCGGTRQDATALCRLLAGYINHPNVAGATILSLGCQHAQVAMIEAALAEINPHYQKPLLIFDQQKAGTEKSLLEAAMRETMRGMADANELRRESAPISDLIVGVECGGSDGFSGLSANPVVGQVADLVAALGGTTVLSEFPELCGVEQELCDRCVTAALAERFARLMRDYAAAAEACGSGFDCNPSPGNIREGLITDAMKSAGASRKGGTAPIIDVLDYGEAITQRGGLTLYCTPGNDVESTTALAGGGCTVMLFTTGLGTPTGNPICPTLKISTHTALAQRMPDIIDFDAGPLLRGERSLLELGEQLFSLTLQTASGTYLPHAVQLGQDDFLPWKRGVSL